MNLLELKQIVDANCERIPNGGKPEDISVLITTKDPSIGPRASVGVEGLFMGFDWESNQLRIEPAEKIVRIGNRMDDVKPAVLRAYNGKNYYWCPKCGYRVGKEDRFCKTCGQKMK